MARARMTRSELKAQDEITSTLERLTESAIARKKEVLSVVVAIVVLGTIIYAWRVYAAGQNASAQKQLRAVMVAFQATGDSDTDRFEKTIVEAQKLIADYPSSAVAPVAQYYLALSQNGLGDEANAVKNLEEVIGRGSTEVKPIAQFALAGLYEHNGELQKAIDVLKQLDASGGYSRSAVAYELARLGEAASQNDLAQNYYSKVITDYPDSPFRTDAETALKRMGLPIPSPAPVEGVTPTP